MQRRAVVGIGSGPPERGWGGGGYPTPKSARWVREEQRPALPPVCPSQRLCRPTTCPLQILIRSVVGCDIVSILYIVYFFHLPSKILQFFCFALFIMKCPFPQFCPIPNIATFQQARIGPKVPRESQGVAIRGVERNQETTPRRNP